MALSLLGGNQTSHFVPILNQLHRLPVKCCIHFKICTITFQTILENQLPDLLVTAEMLKISILYKFKYIFVPLKTKTVSRALFIASPALWNALPVPIHNAQTILTFRKLHKSCIFDLAFPLGYPSSS